MLVVLGLVNGGVERGRLFVVVVEVLLFAVVVVVSVRALGFAKVLQILVGFTILLLLWLLIWLGILS